MVIREVAVDFAKQFYDFAAQGLDEIGRELAGHSIAAIHDYFEGTV
ncbi:deoxyuridine 5'-triphosphate nucleotidohydrolase [Nitrococcus mobilis Nb-231]|uniref:Deoxyuridine 5'-triphosphate nucleotidohydrolase n=1 Tax=Nitrococcus mobilis Nb-231 TaxID=314278 RepID=A4BU22_9GAMM|nr:deoxyuridine 5'-triphosphate nucleotidohydrolase [Nitrococcus mobilis Nb-231]